MKINEGREEEEEGKGKVCLCLRSDGPVIRIRTCRLGLTGSVDKDNMLEVRILHKQLLSATLR